MACACSQYRQLEAVRRATNSAPVDRALRCSRQCDFFDALMCSAMSASAVPSAFANFPIPNLRKKKAAPFSARWQATGALAGELIDQGLLCMATDVRTDLTIV